jgi:hypothetical protein
MTLLAVQWWQDPKVLFDGGGIAVILFILGLVIRNRRPPRGDTRKQSQMSGAGSTNIQAGRDIGNVDLGKRNGR